MYQFVSKLTGLLVLCVVLLTGGSNISFAQTTYSVTDLGDLPGGNNSSAGYGINDNGQVVGSSSAATGVRAFLWDRVNGMQDLGDLPGGDDVSYAIDINNNGQVVGLGHTELGGRAFLWDSVFGMQDLGGGAQPISTTSVR